MTNGFRLGRFQVNSGSLKGEYKMFLKFTGLFLAIFSLYSFAIVFKKGFSARSLAGYLAIDAFLMALGLWLLGILKYF